MTEQQLHILQDIYHKTQKELCSAQIGQDGFIEVNTQQKRDYANDLKSLQNDGYISGISNKMGMDGVDRIVAKNVQITQTGIKFVESANTKSRIVKFKKINKNSIAIQFSIGVGITVVGGLILCFVKWGLGLK